MLNGEGLKAFPARSGTRQKMPTSIQYNIENSMLIFRAIWQ